MSNKFGSAGVEDASRYLSERGTTVQKDESNGEVPLMIPAIKYLSYGTIKDCAEICGIALPERKNGRYGVGLSVNPGSDEKAGYNGEIAIYAKEGKITVNDDIFARTLFPEVYDSIGELNPSPTSCAYSAELNPKYALVGVGLLALAGITGCIHSDFGVQGINESDLQEKLTSLGATEENYIESEVSCIGENKDTVSICDKYFNGSTEVEICFEGERIYGTDENGTEWALGCDNGSVALVIPDGKGGEYLFPTTCPDGCQG